MADQSDIRYQAGEAAGQAQMKKDEMMESAQSTAQESKTQAAGFMQQTGEKMMNMAQGAADAVKNAVGIGGRASNDSIPTINTDTNTSTKL
ncbi:late embryogenesis abundant protein 29-like [Canna indica]|uniref:Late embryogenesis abundant protein 29-like n=1 Tax=Canna indica TaxID=4628 RepID=A0AAQ3JYS8_9LILI|nr:late embryogenesis abundant protein 29-like [Canna indica]